MSSPAEWKTWEGTINGKFPLRQWLGGSDHSAVFLTERPGTTQKFAIKLIADDATAGWHLANWKAAAQLSHPHLMRVYESGLCRHDGMALLYLVMEYAEEDLGQILPQRALTPAEVTELLPPLLDALAYLHGHGLVHGRVKPSNVQATGDLLKLSADSITPFSESIPANSRRDVFDAPEMAAGTISPASDVWSVGVTVLAALSQNVSFDTESPRDPDPPATVPPPFRGIARECLHLDPKRRCSLDDIQARLQPAGKSVAAEIEVAAPPRHKVNRGLLVAGGLLAVILAILTIFVFRGKNSTREPVTEKVEQPAVSATAETTAQSQPAAATTPAEPMATDANLKKPASSAGEVVHKVLPEASRSALSTINGTVKVAVRVDVDGSGKVTAVRFAAAGPSKYFSNLALRAAEQWEFSPPQVDGRPMPSHWEIEFRYKRNSTQAESRRVTH